MIEWNCIEKRLLTSNYLPFSLSFYFLSGIRLFCRGTQWQWGSAPFFFSPKSIFIFLCVWQIELSDHFWLNHRIETEKKDAEVGKLLFFCSPVVVAFVIVLLSLVYAHSMEDEYKQISWTIYWCSCRKLVTRELCINCHHRVFFLFCWAFCAVCGCIICCDAPFNHVGFNRYCCCCFFFVRHTTTNAA